MLGVYGLVFPRIPFKLHFAKDDHNKKFHLRTQGLLPLNRLLTIKPALRLFAFRSQLVGLVSLSQLVLDCRVLMFSSFFGTYHRLFHGFGRTTYGTISCTYPS